MTRLIIAALLLAACSPPPEKGESLFAAPATSLDGADAGVRPTPDGGRHHRERTAAPCRPGAC